MMRINIRFLTLILLFVVPAVCWSQLSPVFIPNAGQWDENILHKMSVENGDVYMERGRIRFAFYDEEFFHHLHAHGAPDSVLKVHAFNINFLACNTDAVVTEHDKGSALYNYYLGKDQSKWASGLTSSRELVYHDIYPKINLRVVSTLEGIKYEFVVLPGGNPKDIKLDIEGADNVHLRGGELQVLTSTRNVVDKAPYTYCRTRENEIETNYVLLDSVVSFEIVGNYNRDDTLVIDPDLVFSTYSGSTANNFGFTATYDDLGFLYSGSSVFQIGYPTTVGAYSVVFSSNPTGGTDVVYDPNWGFIFAGYTNTDIGITKYDTSGTKLIYSTYLGGELCEVPHSIIVNSDDELMILGTTGSASFPTTAGAYDNSFAGGPKVNLSRGIAVNYVNGADIFISKLSDDGTQLLASTYLGGSDNDGINEKLNYNYADQMRGDIAVDSNDNVYISSCTYSSDLADFNGVQTANNGGSDGLVAKFDGDLTALTWGTYLGGSEHDACYSLVLDEDNNNEVIVAGGTASNNFVTTTGVVSPGFQGAPTDGFISKISNDGNTINASTYYGTHAYDQVYFVRIDDEKNIYVYGQSLSMDGSLIFNAAYNSVNSGMFISKLSNDLSNVIWSTTFGSGTGVINLSPTAFAVDICNNIYLSGWGSPSPGYEGIPNWVIDPAGLTGHHGGRGTSGMEVTADAFKSTTNGNDFYLLVLDDDANTLQYGSFYGGDQSAEHVDGGTSRFDRKGNIYQSVCAGCGGNDDFPIKPQPGAWSAVNNSSCNNGVFKFDFQIPAIVADFLVPEQGCLGAPYEFLNTSNILGSTTYEWSFGDDSTSTAESPTHEYKQAGTYNIKLIIRDPVSCNLIDSISKTITLRSDSLILAKTDTSCIGDSLQIVLPPGMPDSTSYSWSPRAVFSDDGIYEPKVLTDSSLNLVLIVTNEPGCADTILYPVFVPEHELLLSNDIACFGDTVLNFVETDTNFVSYRWSTDTSFSDQLNNLPTDTSFVYPVVNVDTAFYIKVVDVIGCEFVDSLVITAVDFDLQLSADSTMCDTVDIWANIVNYSNEALDSIAWSPSNQITQGGDSTFALLDLNYGQNAYEVYARDTFGCADVDTVQHFLRSDSLSLLKMDTTCLGDSLQIALSLSFLDSSNYNWTPGQLFSDSAVYLPKVLVDSTINLLLIVEQYPGCEDTILHPVFVPSYELRLSDSIVCFGDTVLNYVASDTSFVSYRWSTDTSFSDQLNNLPTDTSFIYPVVNADTTFYIKVVDVSGCEFVDSLVITAVDFDLQLSAESTMCDTVDIWANIVNYSNEALDSIAWSPSNQITQGGDSTFALLDLNYGQNAYEVYARDTFGCADVDTVQHFLRSDSLSLLKTDTTCLGDSLQIALSLSFLDSSNYNWTPGQLFSDSAAYLPKVLVDSTINLMLIVEQYPGCEDTILHPVFVPTYELRLSDSIVCFGDTVLNYVASDTSFVSYRWSTDTSFSDQLNNLPTDTSFIYPVVNADTTFYIKVVDVSGCEYVDSLVITAVDFDLQLSADSTMCDTIDIWANIVNYSNEALDSIAWSPSNQITQGGDSTFALLDLNYGQNAYEVYARDTFGCADVDTVQHFLRSDSLSLLKTDTTCLGDSLQIALSLSFLDSSNYNWTPGQLFSDSAAYLPKVLVDSTINLMLIVEQHPGCEDTILHPVYVPSYKLSLSDSIACVGDTILNYVNSNPGFIAYQWSSQRDFSDQLNEMLTDTAFSYPVTEGDSMFYLRIADVNECEFLDSLKVKGVDFQLEVNLDTIVCDTVAIWENIISHKMIELDSIAWSPANKVYQGQDSTSALLDIYAYLSDFQVYARDTNGCVAGDSIRIIDNSLNEDLNDTTVCFGDTISLGYKLSYNTLYTYEWIPDIVFNKDSIFTEALLTDSMQVGLVINNGFCIDTVNQFISVNRIEISSELDTILCNNTDPLVAKVNGEDSLSYLWSSSPLFSNPIQYGPGLNNYVFIPPVGENTYYVRAHDDFGCWDTTELKVTSSLYDLSYPADSTLCLNDSVLLSPNEDLAALGDLKFNWSPSQILHSDTSGSSVLAYGNGEWIVKVITENQYGCGDTDLITLSFASLDTGDISATVTPSSIVDNETTIIEVLPAGYVYEISPDESETRQDDNKFTVLPKESKTYLLTVIDSLYGKCRNITTVDVEVLKFICDDPYIYVPNAFTPNGDGENDVLYVRGKNISKMYFAIFNRWGQKVFETEQQHIGWDGLYEGMQIDPAVYDYYLEYECVGEEEHFKKGNITLIR